MATVAFYLYENVERYERMDCYYLALFYWLFCTQLAVCLLSLLASQAPSAPLRPRPTSSDLARPLLFSPDLAQPRPISLLPSAAAVLVHLAAHLLLQVHRRRHVGLPLPTDDLAHHVRASAARGHRGAASLAGRPRRLAPGP